MIILVFFELNIHPKSRWSHSQWSTGVGGLRLFPRWSLSP